jgi:hypothetical protein
LNSAEADKKYEHPLPAPTILDTLTYLHLHTSFIYPSPYLSVSRKKLKAINPTQMQHEHEMKAIKKKETPQKVQMRKLETISMSNY